MKMQTKLFLNLFASGMGILLCSSLSGFYLGFFPNSNAGMTKIVALFIIIISFIAGFSYLISVTLSRRLVSLAMQAEEICLHPSLHKIDISGPNDEISSLAKSLNELKSKLTKGEEIRNQLVADVSHELRTPVAIIRGQLETILKGAEELNRENLLPLLDETKRMSRLIQEMRDLNLAEAGRLKLDWTWVPFGSTLHEIVSIMEVEAEAKEIVLHLQGEGDGEVYCDVSRIKQVLINLIGNAIRYMPIGGMVRIDYKYEGGRVQVKVTDNGPGIAPENLPYIFKRFYRVEASRNRMSGGTGLGLAIAKEFMEAHGGTIQVASQVGEGTAFTLTLPVFPLTP